MASHMVATCLVACLLVVGCSGAGSKATAKAKTQAKTKAKVNAQDPWDVPDGGSEELEPAGDMESEMSPEDQAGMMQQVAARSAMRRAHNQHAVMKQFMTQFANNMRLSVLADSKGDMPEAERQRLIAKAEAQKEGYSEPAGDAGPGFGPPPPMAQEADDGEEMEAPPPPPRRHPPRRHRMLNMAATRHQASRHRPRGPRLLPEAEGIGFPAPEGMASDPASEDVVNDPGMTAPSSYEAPPQEEEEAPAPRPHRHHLHMLNARGSQVTRKAHHHAAGHHAEGQPALPPGVVRDEMGRAMPLLSFGSNPSHSGVFKSACAPLLALAIACLLLTPW